MRKIKEIPTGVLLAAAFTHETSRHGDPMLHHHLLLMNATYDALTNRWQALNSTPYYRLAKSFDRAFQHELVRHLRAAEVDARIERVDRVEVAVLPAVPGAICERLSRARQAIVSEQTRLAATGTLVENGSQRRRQARLLNDRLRPARASFSWASARALAS